MEERLFSTGDSNLDLLLTEVYYSGLEDGYDYAQREFSDYDDDDDDEDRISRKPGNLENYTDYDLKHMTRGQMLDALEEEEARAKSNTKKYVKHHGDYEAKRGAKRGEEKGRRSGTISGSITGAILGGAGGFGASRLVNEGT